MKMYGKSKLEKLIKSKKKKDIIHNQEKYNQYKKIEKGLMGAHRISDALEFLENEGIAIKPLVENSKDNYYWNQEHFYAKEYVDGMLFQDFKQYNGSWIDVTYYVVKDNKMIFEVGGKSVGLRLDSQY